jgi:peptidoglycan/xylan/chitin deacetylase (PgdA/CDA1 family)
MKVRRDDPIWRKAFQEIYKSPEELEAQSAREVRRGQRLPKLMRGNPALRELALTFDDGPHAGFTPRLLDLLKSANVTATFFVIGEMAEAHPELIRAIAAGGHLIANHTFSHVTLTKIPDAEAVTEYRANNDLIRAITGQTMKFCRPPGGDYDADVIQAGRENGLTTVLWTDDPGDYAQPGTDVIQRRTLAKLSNGGILLLHDGVDQTLQVLPQILAYAKAQGYKFVTVEDLLKHLPQPPERAR